jgi:hypothetical protein
LRPILNDLNEYYGNCFQKQQTNHSNSSMKLFFIP